MIALIASSNECRRLWFESFANKKLGEDMDINSWISFDEVARPKSST